MRVFFNTYAPFYNKNVTKVANLIFKMINIVE